MPRNALDARRGCLRGATIDAAAIAIAKATRGLTGSHFKSNGSGNTISNKNNNTGSKSYSNIKAKAAKAKLAISLASSSHVALSNAHIDGATAREAATSTIVSPH